MKEKHRTLAALLSITTMLVVGCVPSNSSHNGTSNRTSDLPSLQIRTSKTSVDGAIASIQKITTYQSYTGSDVVFYKVFYWSNGYKVEAFVSEPSTPGDYPLLVNLHGGAVWPSNRDPSFGTPAQAAASLANATTVVISPEYEGYMESQGKVMGIKTDTRDVQNAIRAAKSMGEVKPHHAYLLGYSLGGGLALMIAGIDRDVKAVVAVSPFVGLDDFVPWAQAHAKPETVLDTQLNLIGSSYGYNVDSAAYRGRSPNVNAIHAPVLLLQGTADQQVSWQTVQLFANQMKAAHKNVKLVLYPGGQHGLHDQFAQDASQQIVNWFKKYGLDIQ